MRTDEQGVNYKLICEADSNGGPLKNRAIYGNFS
jgi:hypothetical protein